MITLTHSSCSVTGFNRQTEHSGSRKLDSEMTRTTTHVEQDSIPFGLTPGAVGLCLITVLVPYSEFLQIPTGENETRRQALTQASSE